MAKVLIHDDHDGQIHFTKGHFIDADRTICDKKLHPISTTHTPELRVTCTDCIRSMSEKQLIQALHDIQNEMGILFAVGKDMGFTSKVIIGGLSPEDTIVGSNLCVDQANMAFEFVKIPEAIKYDPRMIQKGAYNHG